MSKPDGRMRVRLAAPPATAVERGPSRDTLAMMIDAQNAIAAAGLNTQRVMELVAERSMTLIRCDGAAVVTPYGQDFVYRAVAGAAVPYLGHSYPTAGSLCDAALAHGIAQMCSDVDTAAVIAREFCHRVGIRSLIAVPLPYGDEFFGVVCVHSSEPDAFTQGDVESMTLLAGFFGSAMAHSRAFQEKSEALDARTAALAALEQSEYRFKDAFDHAPIGMCLVRMTEDDWEIAAANHALANISTVQVDDLVNSSLLALVARQDDSRVRAELSSYFRADGAARNIECQSRTTDGSMRELSITLSSLQAGGRTAVAQIQDISEQRQAVRRLLEFATHDELTTLPNRRLLVEQLAPIVALSERRGLFSALMFIDIDKFKEVNDNHGHHVGDLVLVEVGKRLRAAIRSSDLAARLGGDEFVVVCPDLQTVEDVMVVAHRIDASMAEPIESEGLQLSIRVSIGVTQCRDADLTRIMQNADTAMYAAKTRGGGVVVYDTHQYGRFE